MAPSVCGTLVQSKRSLLAVTWTFVNLLVLTAYVMAIVYTYTAPRIQNYNKNKYNNNPYYYGEEANREEDRQQQQQHQGMNYTSRAMIFAYLWTLVLSIIMALYGTVILGIASIFTGRYYWCCNHAVHKTTPFTIGGFIGSLLMYANLTLICSVLFGEFKIMDYNNNNDRPEGEEGNENLSISSMAFSILCAVLTFLYAAFAAMLYTYSGDLIQENAEDERLEGLAPSDVGSSATYGYRWQQNLHRSGFLGDNFNIGSNVKVTGEGYVQPSVSNESDGYGNMA